MSSSNFVFPPPPPPPPKAAAPDQNNNTQQRNSFGSRGGQGGRGNRGRGRGSGHGFSRGSAQGGRGGAYSAQGTAGYSSSAPVMNTPVPTYPHTRYPHTSFSPIHSQHTNQGATYPPTNYAQPYLAQPAGVQNGTAGYGTVPLPYNTNSQPLNTYTPNTYTPPSWTTGQPSLPTGTPMQMGFDQNYPFNASYNTARTRGSDHAQRGGKRLHGSSVPKPKAPPAVPSFGAPLPLKPPPTEGSGHKHNNKRRKHNLLGLTPRGEEHEESEEDVDEEAAFTGKATPEEKLQFTYRGQTATLSSPADLAAWIEERRKRFPTQKRIEEKKAEQARILEQAQQKRKEALQARNQQREEKNEIPPEQAAAKARAKAEKQRRKQLKKEEREAAERNAFFDNLEDKLIKQPMPDPWDAPILPSESEAKATINGSEEIKPIESPPAPIPVPSQHPPSFPPAEPKHISLTNKPHDTHDGNMSDASSDISDMSISSSSTEPSPDEDETSSSGGSSSDESDHDDDSDAAPEETSTRRTGGPEKVPPPPKRDLERQRREQVCKYFARTGGCKRGNKCAFKHERPEGAVQLAADKAARRQAQLHDKSSGRMTLHQRLLARQQEEEEINVIQAIKFLGDRGFFVTPGHEPGPANTDSGAGTIAGPSNTSNTSS